MNSKGYLKRLYGLRRLRAVRTLGSGTLLAAALAARWAAGAREAGDLLMIAATLTAGTGIALRAAAGLRHRHLSIDLLVTIAAAGALVIGEYWEAAAVTFLFTLGADLEAHTLRRTRQVLKDLLDLAPTTALVVRAAGPVEVPAHEVALHETVLIKPGARVPVDGEIIGGSSVVDESPITGESVPAEKEPGGTVYAGTVNLDGLLTVRATGTGADTTLARIIRRVEEAQEARAPTQRIIDRFARSYTPLITALSGGLLLLTRDVELALTILVIACPGALVVAAPVAIVAGIGRAARRGILIKGGEYLESAAAITALALDKTGTVTEGRPRVTHVIPLEAVPVAAAGDGGEQAPPDRGEGRAGGAWHPAQQEVLRWAAAAEEGSEHPLARAIVDETRDLAGVPAFSRFQTWTGRGVTASVGDRMVTVGSPPFMRQQGLVCDHHVQAHLEDLGRAGRTAVVVALDGAPVGIVGIADGLRPAAPEMIRRIRAAGVRRIVLLTGDNDAVARTIADDAGIGEVRSGLLPEDKLEAVCRLQAEGHVVAMLGDGINDAPALAGADIGIAMGAAGTDAAIESADIALMTDDLLKIPIAIELSRATRRNIRQNVTIALVTVIGLLVGVLQGSVHMAGGMLIHQASVLLVILNGMRLLRR